jgi:S-adenosylmethionine:tRNA ribosyltransferase-isomerase
VTPATVQFPTALPLDFGLDDRHIARQPAEHRWGSRQDVRLLVSNGSDPPIHSSFGDLPEFLEPGDLVVVNTSGTIPAAIDAELADGTPLVIHVSTELPGALWMVEPRRLVANGSTEAVSLGLGSQQAARARLPGSPPPLRFGDSPSSTSATRSSILDSQIGRDVRLSDGTVLQLLRPAPGSQRLWLAAVGDDVDLITRLGCSGRPIRYSYIEHDFPLEAYQTVFANEPGSAEMPSAARPFTTGLVTDLVRRGITMATITLHTGVSSLEGHELPYPERYWVPASTAALANATRATGGHVIAVGTTVVRALESTVDATGTVHPGNGWTDVVITPERGVRAVDGLVSGWHEPAATHLAMLEAVAGRDALISAYGAAFDDGYLWHEFGDSHLMLPYAGRR